RPGPVFAEPDPAAGGEIVAVLELVEAAVVDDRTRGGVDEEVVLAAAVEVADHLGDPVEGVADPADVADAGVGIPGEIAARIEVADVDHPLVEAPAEAAAEARLAGDDALVLVARRRLDEQVQGQRRGVALCAQEAELGAEVDV